MRPMLRAAVGIAAAAVLFAVPSVALAQQNPIPTPIPKGDVRINLQPVATGMTAPIDLRPAPGAGNSRLYITDQVGQVRVLENGSLLPTPFMDVSSRLVPLRPQFDERGFLGFAFHPDYNNQGTPGFGKVYTYTSEPVSATPDTTPFTVPNITTVDNHGVVAEWSVNRATNTINPSTRRELFRYADPQFNHNGGPFHFGPDRNLYIGIGDGGGANDTNPNGHNQTPGVDGRPIGNGQDITRIMGKILRIDPLGNNSANGRYGIPQGNPFAGPGGPDGALEEIYAHGFRNPFRFSFAPNGDLLVADVGQGRIEELDRVVAGGNYGWRYKEGSFRFDPVTQNVSTDTTGLPQDLIDPILQYDHDEGISIIGGFVYRGSRIPALAGKYVFGDFSNGTTGRLFYADLATGEIKEFLLDNPDRPLGAFVKGFGEDANGEIYVLTSNTTAPTGATGTAFLIVPEPTGLSAVVLGVGALLLRRSRR